MCCVKSVPSRHKRAAISTAILSLIARPASARCGGVDYSWTASALAQAHDYVVTMMLYVLYLIYAVSSIVAIIGALQIYFKMNTGEGDITKSILMLLGACLFIIGASIVFPAFYGYQV